MQSERPFKIDLQIGRRKKALLSPNYRCQSSYYQGKGMKKNEGKRMINVTMSSRYFQKNTRPEANPQTQRTFGDNINISEFKIEEDSHAVNESVQVSFDLIKRQMFKEQPQSDNRVKDKESNSKIQNESNNGDQLLQYLKDSQCEQAQRQELLLNLLSVDKKIRFFMDLLKEKTKEFQGQKKGKIRAYQSNILYISKLLDKQLEKTKNIEQQYAQHQRREQEDAFRKLRCRINREGKYGLNFSPRPLSVFSGASETFLLSRGSQYEFSMNKGQHFSFGSKKKENRSLSVSQENVELFLNPRRALLSKKRLNFHES